VALARPRRRRRRRRRRRVGRVLRRRRVPATHPSLATQDKQKKKDDEPGLARPWDTDDSDENATRAQKRGGKIGKRGDGGGPAPQPSGGMSAGVKLN